MIEYINKMLSHDFLRYSKNACFYHLRSKCFPSTICFPFAETVTLIRCHPLIINELLRPSIFPNIKNINYLSAHPGDIDITKRFNSSVQWIFPNLKHPFYENTFLAGKGKIDDCLIYSYISNKKLSPSSEFYLYIPGYSIIDGALYHSLVHQYFSNYSPHHFNLDSYVTFQKFISYQTHPIYNTHHHYFKKNISSSFFNTIMKEDKQFNHPVATPFHNSSK